MAKYEYGQSFVGKRIKVRSTCVSCRQFGAVEMCVHQEEIDHAERAAVPETTEPRLRRSADRALREWQSEHMRGPGCVGKFEREEMVVHIDRAGNEVLVA